MRIKPRIEILGLSEAVHGSLDDSELERIGIDPNSIIDFSTSVNPFGPSGIAVAAITQIPWDRYPDRESKQLRSVLAKRLATSEEELIAGNGSGELVQLIALAYLRPMDTVLIVGPTYSEYARSAVLMGAQCLYCNATVETGFAIPVETVTEMLRTSRPRVLYLCNPNNPTGKLLGSVTIETWAREFDQTLIVVDEAYIEFVWEAKSLADLGCPNIVVLRSLTKAYGLAGLRLGYLIADPEIVRVLCSVRVPWTVNAMAQVAGVAAVQDEEHQERSLTQLLGSKRTLMANIQSLGLNPLPSATHFFLVPVVDAATTRSMLIRSKILVRDCSSFGLPEYIRIATRCPADNAKLVAALSAMCLSGL